MATVTKSAVISNANDFSQLAQQIEKKIESGEFYPSQGLKNTLNDMIRKQEKLGENLGDEIADQQIVIAMSEMIEAFPSILRRAYSGDQLKQDVGATEDQVQEEAFTLENMMNDDIPREVTIEILGDVVPVFISFDDRKVDYKLASYKDGEATYVIA